MTIESDSVAVITGAGSGIGRALSVAFAREKIRGLAIADVNEGGLIETAQKVSALGVQVITVPTDVSKLEEVEDLADQVLAEFGSATHLINNAGVGLIGKAEEVSLEDMRWLMDINFWGVVYGTKTFLPIMRRQDRGHIVNISSVFGLIGPARHATYCASKFAVRGFTESLRHELADTNIFAACVHPGGIRTNISHAARKGENAPDEDKELAPKIFDKLATTTPEEAAAIIIRGIRKKNPRILIGSDAAKISLIQRLFPKRYYKIMDRISGGMLAEFR